MAKVSRTVSNLVTQDMVIEYCRNESWFSHFIISHGNYRLINMHIREIYSTAEVTEYSGAKLNKVPEISRRHLSCHLCVVSSVSQILFCSVGLRQITDSGQEMCLSATHGEK